MALPTQLISTAFVRERDDVEVVNLSTPPEGTTAGEYGPFTVTDTEAFTETLQRSDLTRTDGNLIGLYHEGRGLLALLAGPETVPDQLRLTAAVDQSSTTPTVVLGGTEDEPQTWLVFETTRTEVTTTT